MTKLGRNLLLYISSLTIVFLLLHNIVPWPLSFIFLVPIFFAIEFSKGWRELLLLPGWYTGIHALFLYGVIQIKEIGVIYFFIGLIGIFVILIFLLFMPIVVLHRFRVIIFCILIFAVSNISNQFAILGVYADPINFGYLLVDFPSKAVSAMGIFVLSVLIIAMNLFFFYLIKLKVWLLLTLPILFIFILSLSNIHENDKEYFTRLNLRIIQPNIHHKEREKAYLNQQIQIKNLHDLWILMNDTTNADLTVMGEASLPGIIDLSDTYTNLRTKEPVLSGVVVKDSDRYYSAVVSVDSNQLDLIYTKRSLIPLLETKWLSVQNLKPIYYLKSKKLAIAILICKDALYPDIVRDVMKYNPDIFFILTNTDSPFGFNIQVKAIQMRAIENSRPFVIINQSGGSTVINKFGKITEVLGWNRPSSNIISLLIPNKNN